MAEFNILRYRITVSKDTKAVQDVSQELKKVEQQGKKVAQSAESIAKGFGGIGNVLKTVGIAAFLFNAVKQATASSDAINELNDRARIGAGCSLYGTGIISAVARAARLLY